MIRTDLVKFLAESAAELLDENELSAAERQERTMEAEELLALGSRILNRAGDATEDYIREAA